MTHTGCSQAVSDWAAGLLNRTRLIALAMLVAFTAVAMQPAHAQSSDTWKSVAIIGGSTAAGAIIGHKIAGNTGTVIGAGVGATVGYAIDRKRRQDEYNNQYGYYPNGGYYPANSGYYPDNSGYYGNGGYNGPYNAGAYPGPYGYPSNGYASNTSHRYYARRRR